ECDVPLGVGDIRADGDVSHGAAAAAVHHDGAGTCLGRGEQVPGPDACLDQFGAGQAQDAVCPGVPVAPGVAVGEVGSVAGAEPRRHEAGAFHADIAAAGQ